MVIGFLVHQQRAGKYFVDGSETDSKENIIYGEYKKRVTQFLKDAIGV